MDGPEFAAKHAVTWLTTRIPARLRVLEERYDLPPNSLPDPAKVLDHARGPIAIEDWPSVYVLPQRMNGMRLVEVRPDAAEVYQLTYPVRIICWVRSEGYQATDLLRKRYALAIREALLERKQLSPAATYGTGSYGSPGADVVIDPLSIAEDYSDVINDEAAARTIAGAWVDVNMLVTEVLDGPPVLGEADTVEVVADGDTAILPPHPGL